MSKNGSSFFFGLFGVASVVYGSSQARDRIGAVADGLHHGSQQHGIWAASATYTTANSNIISLTHWAGSRIKPESSRMLVGFVNCWAMMGTTKKMVALKALNFAIYLWFISEIFNFTTLLEISSEPKAFLEGDEQGFHYHLLISPSICFLFFWISYFIFLFLFSLLVRKYIYNIFINDTIIGNTWQ